MTRIMDFMKNCPFCDASDHYHTFCSAPIVNYTENGSLSASPVNIVCMFDKMTDIMRMFIFEDQNDGFYQKSPFCDAPDHCITFHSTVFVNYTENIPHAVTSVNSDDMFDKRVDTMWMYICENQNDGFTKKCLFCDAPDHCRTFHSTPIVNYTENRPLVVSSADGSDMIDNEADIMRIFKS